MTSTINMLYAKRQYISDGTFLTRMGKLVTLNGFLDLPYTLPEEYRPADHLFVPIVVANGSAKEPNYATISTNGKITYDDSKKEDHSIFISAAWRV